MEANLMRQKIGNFLESNSTVFSKVGLLNVCLYIHTRLDVQQKELERLTNNINILGQELADQQQRLDKGVSHTVYCGMINIDAYRSTRSCPIKGGS